MRRKLSPEEALKQFDLAPTLGICMSQVLQGKYAVELQKDPSATPLVVRAKQQAYEKYKDAPFHMVLYVRDADRQATDWITRAVVLSLPDEYVRSNEIEAVSSPEPAKFRLLPLAAETTEPSGM